MLRTLTRHFIYNGINSSKFVKKCVAINLGSIGRGSDTVHSHLFIKCYIHYDGSGDDIERPRFRQRRNFNQEDLFGLDEENEWEPQTSHRRKSTHFDRDRGKYGRRDSIKPRRFSSFSWRRDFDESFEEDGTWHSSESSGEQREIGSRIKKRDWSLSHLTSVEKNFYVEHPAVAEKSEVDIDGFYQEHSITVSEEDRPRPVSSFHEANFPEQVNSYLEKIRWSHPTPIQSLGWPLSLSGKNFVGIAQTGSGKTLGYILPALVHIKHQRQVMQGEGPIVLVLAPTRELAQQIKSVAVEFGRLLGIRSCCVFGGQSKLSQARHLSQGPEIVVATPGRLLDFLEMDVVNLDRTTYVVLDEADRMLDMGFEPQIRKILGQIRPDRQILMWSATWPEEIQQLAHDFLGEFTQVNIGSVELMANPNIEQIVNVCERTEKFGFLLQELGKDIDDEGMGKTLIFVQTKSQADFLTQRLRKHRFNTLAIHGDKTQLVRDKTLSSFRNGKTDILVATDVAARGLDVDDIKLVINYDYPNTVDDYIHRIGRTARASKKGTAITFVSDEDAGKLKDLIKVLKDSGQPISQELSDLARLHSKLGKKAPYKNKFGSSRRNYQSWNNGSYERRKSW